MRFEVGSRKHSPWVGPQLCQQPQVLVSDLDGTHVKMGPQGPRAEGVTGGLRGTQGREQSRAFPFVVARLNSSEERRFSQGSGPARQEVGGFLLPGF